MAWLPSLACMGVIFLSSSFPGGPEFPKLFPHADKLVHFSVYSLLGFLIGSRFAFRERGFEAKTVRRSFDWKGLAVGVAYGVTDEIHQLFVPMREFSYGDMLADALGVYTGLWLSRFLLERKAASRKSYRM